jgi:predicted enzyme related to lactoylglutathione lyase
MNASLSRIILYVHDVERLSAFYQNAFALTVVEHIKDEWAVLKAGACEIALHRVGKAYRVADPSAWTETSNVKLVITVDRDLTELRAELIAKGVAMGGIKSYPGLTGPLCDGPDPEGNMFQLSQADIGASAL